MKFPKLTWSGADRCTDKMEEESAKRANKQADGPLLISDKPALSVGGEVALQKVKLGFADSTTAKSNNAYSTVVRATLSLVIVT